MAPGSSLASATYTITGTGGFSRTAGIDVSKSATLSVVVGTIPAGTGYTLTVNATATDGVTSCLGAATFAVIAGATTPVGPRHLPRAVAQRVRSR